jgi:peptide/nickel transport system substrate-binding protein
MIDRRRQRAGAAIWLTAFALLSACTHGARAPRSSTTLVIAQQREPMSLNPALENGTSAAEWGLLLFQYLVKFGRNGKLIGDAAVAPPTPANGGISRDGLTITYHLRKGLRFADGSPLTARDCVYSIEAILNPNNNVQSRYGYDRIASAQAPNPTTLVLHLKHPFAPLVTLVLAPQGFPILPAHVLARLHDFNHVPFDSQPVGSGPYVVTHWYRGDRVEMRANPYYWQGVPAIRHLTIRFVPDSTTAIDMLRTHEVNGFFNDEDLSSYPLLRAVPGIYVSNEPIDGVGALIFNTADPLTRDDRVRRALAQALDLPAIVTKAYRGALSAHAGARGLFMWAYDPKAYPDVPYDPAHAAALLNAAGWRLGNDGVRRKGRLRMHLLLIIQSQTPGDQIAADMIAAYERKIGVTVTLKQYQETQFVAPATLGGAVYSGKFQLALYTFVNGDDPDTTDQFACSHVPPAGYNKARFCDPRLDALLYAGRSTYDVAARKRLYAAAQRLLYRRLPIEIMYQVHEVSAFTRRLTGQSTSLSGAFWDAGRWRLTP